MAARVKFDIAIIGAGSGGLSVAAGAAQLGAKVALIEAHKMGGDCLNTGCVPSKALIAAAGMAHAVRHSARFGVNGHDPQIDFARVHAHVHGVIAAIAPHDSVERFEGLGVHVLKASGRFTGHSTVAAGETEIEARRIVIATGSRTLIPEIPGLDRVPYLTNETVFDLMEAPAHLVVIGGGPIGVELAQAHRRLGAQVTIIEAFKILPKDDPEAVDVVRQRLRVEGIDVLENARVLTVGPLGNGAYLDVDIGGIRRRIEGSHLLLAAGRRPHLDGLELEAAGIEATPAGIKVDKRLRTSNRRVFAIGDVAGGYQFTHLAGYQAGIVIRNALFNLPASVDTRAVPWVTYSDPELAHVGMNEAQAQEIDGRSRALRWSFENNDRAQAERETAGFAKVVVSRNGRVLGATIVGQHAGELILPWVIAVHKQLGIGDMTSIIAPYPTLSEISKRVAGAWYTPRLFSERSRRVVRLMQMLP